MLSSALINLRAYLAGSKLRIQFTTDERYQAFLARSVDADVLGIHVKIACLEDVTQGKLWAFGDPQRRLSKRKKYELDLIRRSLSWSEKCSSPRATGPDRKRLLRGQASLIKLENLAISVNN
jgi:hypothetical protein